MNSLRLPSLTGKQPFKGETNLHVNQLHHFNIIPTSFTWPKEITYPEMAPYTEPATSERNSLHMIFQGKFLDNKLKNEA